ncbi:MAG: N-acetylmuramic acid 6-phosphate etherase [Alphaproteobacteria bacterium]|nr:N-acetylmuramic acid 6-phosphate etherase [Alphaproteobacteria bacterium]
MTEKTPTTESIPDASRWLDALSSADAMAVMADDQAAAVAAVKDALAAITEAALAAYECLERSAEGRLFYAGAGTSIRIGVQDGVELTPTFDWPEERTGFLIAGGDKALTRSIENAEDDGAAAFKAVQEAELGPGDVLIGIAASGATPYTCAAITSAGERGALTIGIANNRDAPLTALSDHGITLLTGAEAVAGSTRMKAGTAQKICLNLMSTLIMVRMGKVRNGMMAAMRPTNAKLRERQKRIDAALKS